jgi:hypothetical protein
MCMLPFRCRFACVLVQLLLHGVPIAALAKFVGPELRKTATAYIATEQELTHWKQHQGVHGQGFQAGIDYESHLPYQNGHLVHLSKTPVLTKEECNVLYQAVEDLPKFVFADEVLLDGTHPPPRTKFNVNVGMDLDETAVQVVRRALYERVYPMLQAQFAPYLRHLRQHQQIPSGDDEGAALLRVAYTVVVSYDAETLNGKRELFLHNEPYVVSFSIPLVPRSYYKGGGTVFPALRQSYVLEQGHMVSHASGIQHDGERITKGKRSVLVGFCVLGEQHDDWSRQFLNQVSRFA